MIHAVFDNRFKIEEPLKISPASEVYRARDLQTDQRVALKLIRPRFMVNEQFGARLKQEFQVLKNLDHPSVVKVIQIGKTSDNMVFFAMEFVEGKTLGQIIEQNGPMHPDRVAALVEGVAGALDAAHGHKIVHRDINPDNIMVVRDDKGNERAKLFDFGLAKVLDEEPEQALVQTGAAVVKGSAEFMSPEQAMGKQVSKFSDIYSLGVTVFKALTGGVPFVGKNDLDTIIGHVKKPIPRFSDINPSNVVPVEVENVVRHAMAKDTKDRPQTAGLFSQMFRNAVRSHPTPKTPYETSAGTPKAPTGAARAMAGAPLAGSAAATAAPSMPRPKTSSFAGMSRPQTTTVAPAPQSASSGNKALVTVFVVALIACVAVLGFIFMK